MSAAVSFASSQLGTWKLNESRSQLAPAAGKNHTVIYEAAGDDVKITVDGTDAAGKPTHNEWTGRFDGKDYPVVGDPQSDTRSYTIVDANTLDMTIKKDGKVTITGRIAVSADGRMRTVTLNGTDDKGQKVTSTVVYDRQ
jgi:hypothetical protein